MVATNYCISLCRLSFLKTVCAYVFAFRHTICVYFTSLKESRSWVNKDIGMILRCKLVCVFHNGVRHAAFTVVCKPFRTYMYFIAYSYNNHTCACFKTYCQKFVHTCLLIDQACRQLCILPALSWPIRQSESFGIHV